ncbi:MAG: GIY-YIG nuclease family protein [Cyanobacteria bacterium REEB459]|nr:GIY-YIG nuclease family protein [Cyanobacteria bacterium REEB459]
MTADYQPSLLSDADLRAADLSSAYAAPPRSRLTEAELQAWKQRVASYQQQQRQAEEPDQGVLFAVKASPAKTLDPFSLAPKNAEFWRESSRDSGVPALYFVVDHQVPLLLYIGETGKSNQRWQGVHDCKRYILQYVEAHRGYHLAVAVNIGFWPHAASQRKVRQALEAELIRRWRSPFNKENWTLWSTPFVGDKP